MLTSKLTGLFRKKSLRSSDDGSVSNDSRQRFLSINCHSADKGYLKSGDINSCSLEKDVQTVGTMGAYRLSTGSCDGLSCHRLGPSGCGRCVLPSESAAYPVDSTTSTYLSSSSSSTGAGSYLSSSPEPLCCCEDCSWLVDSYPYLTKLRPLSSQTSLTSSTSTLEHSSFNSQSSLIPSKGRTTSAQTGKLQRAAENNNITSISIDSSTACRPKREVLPDGGGSGKEEEVSFPVSVMMSAGDEESYQMSQHRLSVSNRLRQHVTSYNFEVGKTGMSAPPNKSICHVVR